MTEQTTASTPLASRSAEELTRFAHQQERAYADLRARGLALDLTRGKPSSAQLDLSSELLSLPKGFKDASGTDTRNYGGLQGIAELRQIFAELLWVEPEQVVAGGNSSLVMMREVRGELRKVAWPTREEIVRYSIIVLVTVVLLTAFVNLIDYLSTEAILYLFD